MQLSPSAGHPYQAIAAQVIRNIEAGDLAPDSKLPSVRELAKTFGVTVATAQRALSQLAADGYVKVIPGHGSFVRDRPTTETAERTLTDQLHELREDVAALRSRIEAVEQRQAAAPRGEQGHGC
jgi:DNA-binding GntR family transcriptional regulator